MRMQTNRHETVIVKFCSIEKNSVIVALTTGDVRPNPAPKTPTSAIMYIRSITLDKLPFLWLPKIA